MAIKEAEVIKKQKEEPKPVVVNPWLDVRYKNGAPLLTREPGIETIDDLPERLGLLDDESVESSIEATKFIELSDTPSDYGDENKFAHTDGDGNITWQYPFWKPSGRGIYYREKVAVGHSHPKTDFHLFKPATSCTLRIGAKLNPWAQWESTDENNGFAAGISDAANKIFKMRYESPIGTASQLFQCFDAGNTRIGAFTASPQVSYHIKVSATSSATYHPNTVLAVESTTNTMIQVSAGTNAGIVFCDATSNPPPGAVIYDHGNDWLEFSAGGNEVFYIKSGYVTTADNIELAVGDFGTPTNPFHVQDEGTTGGWGGSYGGVVARFRHSGAKHTSIVVDAQTGYDPVFGFCENASVIWSVRNDASGTDKFQIRYHVGAANSTAFQIDNAGHIQIGRGVDGIDYTLTFNGYDNNGVITWMEDEDYFLFGDGIVLADGESLSLQEDITFTGATTENLIKIPDHLAVALDITEAGNSYLKFVTTNGSEAVVFGKDVGIGTAPARAFHVSGSIPIFRIQDSDTLKSNVGFLGAVEMYDSNGDQAGLFGFDSAGDNDFSFYNALNTNMDFFTNGTHAIRINTSQYVGIGTATATPLAKFELAHGSGSVENLTSVYSTTNAHIPIITMFKSDTATVGSKAQTDDGDELGYFRWQGVDSGSNKDYGAYIRCVQNGAAGGRVPTDMIFATATDSAITERMILNTTGNLGLKQTTFGTNAVGVFAQGNGTAPTTSPADCFQMYSADIGAVAGKAGAHFRDEEGNIVSIGSGGMIATGTARVIRETWIDAGGIKAPLTNPAELISHGALETPAWQFANAIEVNEETISFNMKFPTDCDMTAVPVICIGWSTTTTDPGNDSEQVEWQLEYLYTQLDEPTNAGAEETLYVTSTASETAEGLVVAQFTGMNVPNANDVCLHCRLKRLSAAAAGSQTDSVADDVELHGVVLLYTSNKQGSPT